MAGKFENDEVIPGLFVFLRGLVDVLARKRPGDYTRMAVIRPENVWM